jgi:hypothetical protein
MTRIFTTLAVLVGLGLAASYGLGVVSFVRDSARNPADSTFLIHFTVGLFASLGTILLHCIIFTYFLGTGRWVKEVAIAYSIADEPLPRLTRELKRRTFPPALAAMLMAIATVAAGAGVQQQLPGWSWPLHGGLATAALLVNLWAFRIEYQSVRRNGALLLQVLQEVDRLRLERGLPSNAQALAEQT